VGAWNTVFGYLVFVGLDTGFSHLVTRRYVAYMSAMILGNIIAIVNAFIFHKYITFKSPVKGRGIVLEFARFCTTYLVTFGVSVVLLPLIVELGGIDPKTAGALVILICTGISYLGHSRFSFRREFTC
jgi:putative flippase GtrA